MTLATALGCGQTWEVPAEVSWWAAAAWRDGGLVAATPLSSPVGRVLWHDPEDLSRWRGYPPEAFDEPGVDQREPLRLRDRCEPALPPAPFGGELEGPIERPAGPDPTELAANWLTASCARPALEWAWQSAEDFDRGSLDAGPGCRVGIGAPHQVLGLDPAGVVRSICDTERESTCVPSGVAGCTATFDADLRALVQVADPNALDSARIERVQVVVQAPLAFDPGFGATPDAIHRGRLVDLAIDPVADRLVVAVGHRAPETENRCPTSANRIATPLANYQLSTLAPIGTTTIAGCIAAITPWVSPEFLMVRRRREGPEALELIAGRSRPPVMLRTVAPLGNDIDAVVGLATAGSWAVVATEGALYVVDVETGLVARQAQAFRVAPRIEAVEGGFRVSFVDPVTDAACEAPLTMGARLEATCHDRCDPRGGPLLSQGVPLSAARGPNGWWSNVVGRNYGVMTRCDPSFEWVEPIEAQLRPIVIEPAAQGLWWVAGLAADPQGVGVSVLQRFDPVAGRYLPGRRELGGAFPTLAKVGPDGAWYFLLARSGQVARVSP